MPRDVYKQSSGNPLQYNRLPRRTLHIAFPYRPMLPADERFMLRGIFIVALVIWLLSVAFFCFTTSWGIWGNATTVFVSSIVLALLTWHFGRHWTGVCTVTPLARDTSALLRKSWNGYLLILALLMPVTVLIGIVTCQLSTSIAFVGLVALSQVVRAFINVGVARGLRTIWASIVSWLTYNSEQLALPGLYRSAGGVWRDRMVLSIACVILTTITSCCYLSAQPKAFALPVLFAVFSILLPVGLTLPVLAEAAAYRRKGINPKNWNHVVNDIQTSPNPIERRSVIRGRVVFDGSPVLVPREVFNEHAHFLGDSGSGKTSLGLLPTMEQVLASGDCSMVVIDLKADSYELLASLYEASNQVRLRTGRSLPIQHFSNQTDKNTFGFNVLTQPYWKKFSLYMRADILCGTLGLHYGSDYGEGYYSSANAAVIYQTVRAFPNSSTFQDLAERVRFVTSNPKKFELNSEICKAGAVVQQVLKRLGSFEALNVAPGLQHSSEVVDNAIDLTRPFREPSLTYFHLSASLSPGSAPEIARLVSFFLLCAATQTQRKHRVYLVIDEFQRMVSRNMAYLLQLARSMGVSVILANQSMQDLKTSTADLIPVIETNCRYREWFAVSSQDDRRRLIEGSGETIDYMLTESSGTSSGGSTSSNSRKETILPRLTANDILLASDHPHQSIVRISRGAGYAQYGGFPLIIENNFHITADEYARRKKFPWPEDLAGSFMPQQEQGSHQTHLPNASIGPVMTSQVIDGRPLTKSLPEDTFGSFLESQKSKDDSHKSRRGRKQ